MTRGKVLQEGPWLITLGSLTGLRSPWEIHKAHFWVRGFLERINRGEESCPECGDRGSDGIKEKRRKPPPQQFLSVSQPPSVKGPAPQPWSEPSEIMDKRNLSS